MEIRVEKWCDRDIRFVNIDGEWWAVLHDIAKALGLRSPEISRRVDCDFLTKAKLPVKRTRPSSYNKNHDVGLTHSVKSEALITFTLINEPGIYEALFASRKLEARKFRKWSAEVIKKLRQRVGLEGYEVMRMTEQGVQDCVDYLLDSLYYDSEKGRVMESHTVSGGDVEQRVFV